jgi:hypothetical protein
MMLHQVPMAGFPAALQHRIFRSCRISHAACVRSEILTLPLGALQELSPRDPRTAGLGRTALRCAVPELERRGPSCRSTFRLR